MTSARLIDSAAARAKLLATVAAVLAGVKLSIPRLRDALVSQGDVINALSALVKAGELDAGTLRPPDVAPAPPATGDGPDLSGEQLADELTAYAEKHGLALWRVSMHIFGSRNGIQRLRRHRPRGKTIARVREFLASPPPEDTKTRDAGGPRTAANGEDGAALAAEVDALIERHGLSKTKVGLFIYNNRHGVEVIRQSHPRPKTVQRIRAMLANPPIEELRAGGRPSGEKRSRAIPAEKARCSAPTPPPGDSRSFEEQLKRVERGEVGIAPAFHPRKAMAERTLGGVTGPINP